MRTTVLYVFYVFIFVDCFLLVRFSYNSGQTIGITQLDTDQQNMRVLQRMWYRIIELFIGASALFIGMNRRFSDDSAIDHWVVAVVFVW